MADKDIKIDVLDQLAVSIETAAKLLDVSAATITTLCDRKVIQSIRVGDGKGRRLVLMGPLKEQFGHREGEKPQGFVTPAEARSIAQQTVRHQEMEFHRQRLRDLEAQDKVIPFPTRRSG